MSVIDRFLNIPGLRGLHTNEIDKIASFLKSPGKDEFFFLLQTLDRTPTQVRNLMLGEFIRRFCLEARAHEIEKALPPKRSWQGLDAGIAEFAGRIDMEEHVRFWDKMRHVLAALPQWKDHGNEHDDGHESKGTKPKRGWNYPTCKLCWRRVYSNPGVIRKTANLCFKHNLPSMHPVYRKHRRLEQQLRHALQPIVTMIMALVAECPSEKESRELVYSQLTAQDGCLPRLAKYVDGIGHDGTHESLLWAFHGPASEIEDSLYKEALSEFIQYILGAKDILEPSQPMAIFSIDELCRAEAWLSLLEGDSRRKKS